MGMDADVVIVGAGPVGSALAIMLGRAGCQTLLIDRCQFPRDKPCGEGLMPAGNRVLEELGIGLRDFPSISGVTYHVPGHGRAEGKFMTGSVGRGTRRTGFDKMLADHADGTQNVETAFGCDARDVQVGSDGVLLGTTQGEIVARFLVGADGIRSRVATWMGWSRPARSRRYGLVGHLAARDHGIDRVLITLLDGCEVYLAPSSRDELLVALLGSKGHLRSGGATVSESYSRRVAQAHPELAGCQQTTIHGAGPFWTRPSNIASRRVFLIGDAAGFLDPLTGDGMTAGFVAASKLSYLLMNDADASRTYRHWEARQWRRRLFMGRLALALTNTAALGRRAIRGLSKRPVALDRLLEVNEGSRSLWSLSPRDWAALGGF